MPQRVDTYDTSALAGSGVPGTTGVIRPAPTKPTEVAYGPQLQRISRTHRLVANELARKPATERPRPRLLTRRATTEHASAQGNRLLRNLGLGFLLAGVALILLILLSAGNAGGVNLFMLLVASTMGYACIGAGLVLLLVSAFD